MLRVDEITLFVFLGVDVTWQIQHVISFFVLNFVRLLFLILGLLPLKLLDEEPTLSSGMFRVNEGTLLIFLRVDVARQIHHVISFLVLHLLRVPRSFGLSFELSLNHGQGFSRSSWLGFSLLLPT